MTPPQTPAARLRPGRPRDPAVDAAAIKAALELLLEGGVEHASLDRVARRAHVTKATLYRRWASKEALLADAIDALRQRIPTLPLDPQVDLGAAIARLLPLWAAEIVDPRFVQLMSRMIGLRTAHPSLFNTWQQAYARPQRERARTLLSAAREQGALISSTDDLDQLITVLQGAILYQVTLSDEQLDAAAAEDFLRGLLRLVGFQLPEAQS